MRWVIVVVVLLVSCWPRPGSAHDLAIDQLRLRPDPRHGELAGQLTFDPALTRAPRAPVEHARIEAKVLAFARENVELEVDGAPLRVELELRELWTSAGAVPGDIVMLHAHLPAAPRTLRVRVGRAFRALAVVVESPTWEQGDNSRSALVFGGSESPELAFAANAPRPGWKPGGPDQFVLPSPTTSSVLAPTPRAPPSDFTEPSEPTSAAAKSASTWFGTVLGYCWLGVLHILPSGFDHVLFVVGLTLGARRSLRRLVTLLTLFTVAHTLALALGAMGWIVVPTRVVEPLIALSIAYVGAENLLGYAEAKHRVLVVLAFGLVHGLGFAGVLQGTGLSSGSFVAALLGFNLGVEIGQLLVVMATLLLFRVATETDDQRQSVDRYLSLTIGVIGLFWVATRVVV